MPGKRRAIWIVGVLALLCAAPAGAASLRWNVPGGRAAGDYVLVTEQLVTLELIAEIGPDEALVDGVLVRAEADGLRIRFWSDPEQTLLSSTVDGVVQPWFAGTVPCGLPCFLVNQLNPGVFESPMDYRPVDPFVGVIATVDVFVVEGTVRASGDYFFGTTPDAVVNLLLVPEPSTAALLALGIVAFAVRRRR